MKINQIVHLSEGVAGPKNCWPGYKKTGTQPGTGKNKGKRVNDCEKIKQQVVAEGGWNSLSDEEKESGTFQKSHATQLAAAQAEMKRRRDKGEDMTGAKIDKNTYKIVKPKKKDVSEGGVTVPNADGSLPPGAFTAAGQEQLNKMVGDKMNAPTNEKDLGNGFTLTTTSYNGQNYPAVLDTQGKIYWLERTPNIKTLGFGSHIKIVTGKATAGIPGDQTKDAMKQAGWEVAEPSQGEPQPASSANEPFVPRDYQTKEPLTKGPDGNWRNSKGEARDGLHGGPISSTGTAMFRSLKETDAMANAASRLAKKKKQGVAENKLPKPYKKWAS